MRKEPIRKIRKAKTNGCRRKLKKSSNKNKYHQHNIHKEIKEFSSKNKYVCSIDFTKAFDNVNHGKLLELLAAIGIGYRDVRSTVGLYWCKSARAKVGDTLNNKIKLTKGVRQVCILFSILFNNYFEKVF